MIKKLIGVGLALAFMASLASTAMAQSVDLKFGGWFRYRGIISDNQDLLDTVKGSDLGRDQNKYYDSVFRPTFTASMEDKAQVLFQLDIPLFNQVGGEDCHNFGTGPICNSATNADERVAVNVVVYNLQVKVPEVPGNWFVKVGRDNVFLPRGLVGRLPNLREFGIQLWGTAGIFQPRIETFKRDEMDPNTSFGRGLDFSDDDDVYILKLPFTPMKGVRIMPYLTVWEANRVTTTSATVRQFYPAIEASARYQNFFGSLDFVYQTGTIDYSAAGKAAGSTDKDVSAYVLWAQGGATLGPATVSVNYVLASGDPNHTDTDEEQFFAIGCSSTDSGGGARSSNGPCDARAQGPTDLWFGDKYNDINTVGSRNIGGNTGGTGGRFARGNGHQVMSLDASYKVAPSVLLQGTAGFIWSMYARPDVTTASTTPFKSKRYIGTEIDLNAIWTIYKGVSLSGGFDYLIAGEYGELKTPVEASSQVPGGTNRVVNNNDDAWQAVWMLTWAF